MENETINRELNNTDIILMFVLLLPLIVMSFVFLFQVFETIFIRNYKKPLVVFPNLAYRKLNPYQIQVLLDNFHFYERLKPKYKNHFQHRVSVFTNHYKFIGNGIQITDEMKIIIAASYVMLTFGMRKYLNPLFSKIIIYPDVYYSEYSKNYHKGEFNPKMKAVVFSWNHFKQGIDINNDNLNLGLHEFTHTLHILSLKNKNHTLILFKETLQSLFVLLTKNDLKQALIASNFFREYAYENQFEFVAVLLEYFFESNSEFKQKFPSIYQKVKQMINYNENYFS